MYISEIASVRYRGGLSCINQLAITMGDVVVYSLGAIDSIGWRWLARVPIITAICALILMAFMPETPIWLLSHDRRGKALDNMRWLRGDGFDSVSEINNLQRSLGEFYNIASFFFLLSIYIIKHLLRSAEKKS